MPIPGKFREPKNVCVPLNAIAQMRGSLSGRGAIAFDTEHQMDFASLDERLSTLLREAGVNPSDPPASTKTFRANWRYVAFVGSLLAASIGVAAWWWSSSAHTAMMAPSDHPAPLTQAPPKDATPTAAALSSDLVQLLQPMTHDLAALSQAVEHLKVRQEQLVRGNENVASQLKASQEAMARNNSIVDQIKATQIQMARETQTLTERLNASQEQIARVIANAEPKVMPEIPLPRPRQSANVAQTQKPAPTPARPQAKKPQPSLAWPWSAR
jgi:hypothetical protein